MFEKTSNEIPALYDERFHDVINRWQDFEATVDRTDKIAIVYHGDMDGLLGATYVRRALLAYIPESQLYAYWVGTEEYDFVALRKWIEKQRPDKCVFTDISIENHVSTIKFIDEYVVDCTFIYDHHIVSTDVPYSSKIILVNPTPTKLKPGQQPLPTFLFAKRIAQEKHFKFPDWLLLLSIFSEGVDSFYQHEVAELLTRIFKKEMLGSLREIYQSTPLLKANNLIRAEFASPEKQHRALKLLDQVAIGSIVSLEEFVNCLAIELDDVAESLSKDINQTVSKWKQEIETSALILDFCGNSLC